MYPLLQKTNKQQLLIYRADMMSSNILASSSILPLCYDNVMITMVWQWCYDNGMMMMLWQWYDDDVMMMMMLWWWWCYDDDDVMMMMMLWWWCYDDDESRRMLMMVSVTSTTSRVLIVLCSSCMIWHCWECNSNGALKLCREQGRKEMAVLLQCSFSCCYIVEF